MNARYLSLALLGVGALLAFGAIPLGQSIVGAPSNTGVFIPLYTYPTSSTWSEVTQAKALYPSVPFLAVINPDSGVGASQDANYVSGTRSLQSAGVIVLGYVWTDYAQRPIAQVESEMSQYKTWYDVNGIFLDGASSQSGSEGYYSTLSGYAQSIGLSNTVENQGSPTPSSYIGTSNLFIPYEGAGLPSIASLSAYPRSETAVIAFSVPFLDVGWLDQAKAYTSYVYVTDAGLPNPYETLPSYFMQEVADLATTTTATTTQTLTQTQVVTQETPPVTTTVTNTYVTTGHGSFSFSGGQVLGVGLMAVGGVTLVRKGRVR